MKFCSPAVSASSKGGKKDLRFRIYVELTDKDHKFWEDQALGTPEGRTQLAALRSGLLEVLPRDTELSEAPTATFFEGDTETILANAEPVIAKDGRRAWVIKD
jgi:hypothetical protein